MTTAVDDDLWSAIGDPVRRTMIDLLLAEGSGTATSATAQRRPARLNALLAEFSVIVRSGASGANGRCRCGSCTRSEWISSAMTSTSCSRASAAIPDSSRSVKTRPVGFCGLTRMSAVQPASGAGSKTYPSPSSTSGSGTRRRPIRPIVSRNGG